MLMVDDAPHAGFLGGLEHDLGLLDALFVGAAAVVDADPVGVEQGVGGGQLFGQLVGPVEVEGMQRHLVAEGVLPLRVSGDRLYGVALAQEQLGDVTAGVPGGSGYGVSERLVHGVSLAPMLWGPWLPCDASLAIGAASSVIMTEAGLSLVGGVGVRRWWLHGT